MLIMYYTLWQMHPALTTRGFPDKLQCYIVKEAIMKKLKFGTNWSLGNLLRGLAFVTSDRPTKPVDAILFFTRATGDEGTLFELASETISAGQAKYIITNGGDGRGMGTVPGAAWPGKNPYAQEFQKLSVDPRIIHYSEPAGNTKIAAEEFLKVANGLGCKSAVILNHPHRLLRAGLHIIKELERKNQFLEIYF